MKKWTCRDGTKVRVKDMTTSHIKNAMAMLRRAEFYAIDSGWELLATVHGEMAADAIEQEVLSAEEEGIPEFQEWIGVFAEELLRRGESIDEK
jgi:hypothetical protein